MEDELVMILGVAGIMLLPSVVALGLRTFVPMFRTFSAVNIVLAIIAVCGAAAGASVLVGTLDSDLSGMAKFVILLVGAAVFVVTAITVAVNMFFVQFAEKWIDKGDLLTPSARRTRFWEVVGGVATFLCFLLLI